MARMRRLPSKLVLGSKRRSPRGLGQAGYLQETRNGGSRPVMRGFAPLECLRSLGLRHGVRSSWLDCIGNSLRAWSPVLSPPPPHHTHAHPPPGSRGAMWGSPKVSFMYLCFYVLLLICLSFSGAFLVLGSVVVYRCVWLWLCVCVCVRVDQVTSPSGWPLADRSRWRHRLPYEWMAQYPMVSPHAGTGDGINRMAQMRLLN